MHSADNPCGNSKEELKHSTVLFINLKNPLLHINSNTKLAFVLLPFLIERWQAARDSRPLFISSVSPERLSGAWIMSALFPW